MLDKTYNINYNVVMKKIIGLFVVCLFTATYFLSALAGIVYAAPPKDFQTTQIIGTGLNGPSGFEFAPDGRIFIIQRTGEIKIYKNGQLLTQNFAVLPAIASGDRGLIGIAIDPDFMNNHYIYFYYTGTDKFNKLVRMNASTDSGQNTTVLYQTTSPSEQLHVGGTVQFGQDGKLYFAVGDNGYGPNAQDLSNPHGKILRINKDGSIPVDNPFYGIPGALPEIWAYGLRNPWRFQFDSFTGKLYVGDVGADSWEEVNIISKGGNYGWPNCEGKCVPASAKYIDPIYSYPHTLNGAYQSSAITMGPVYHGSMFPESYQNKIFYGDYSRGTIRTLSVDTNGNVTSESDFDLQAGSNVDMKIAQDGSMYYITYYPGAMYRVTYNTSNHIPVANASANTLKGASAPFTINFSSNGSYDPDGSTLSYDWDFGDGTFSPLPNPSKTYTQNGAYTVKLTVSDGVNAAQARPVVVQVGCPPIVTIGLPKDGSTYKAGDTITVNASAIDCAGFDINDGALSTTVKFHHTTHIHPFLDNLPGRSNTFTVPVDGEPSADTWFEINVTASESNGLSTTQTVNIYPLKANMTFATNPTGLQILIDGIPTGTTQTIQGVVGYQRELNISSTPQKAADGKYYIFDRWSDNGSQRHGISTPSSNATYTAFFKETAAPQDPTLAYTIYDELLGGDWVDWSWNSTNDFEATTSYTGNNALAWKANGGWAGLLLHRNELPLDTTGYNAVTVALRATQAGQKVSMWFYDEFDKVIGKEIQLSNYGGDPIPGVYKVYTIPLTDFGISGKKISDVHIQNYTDNAQPVLFIDRFGLTASAIPTAVPTATPTIQPTATPTPQSNLVQNNSFEATGSMWQQPWILQVQPGAAASLSQDTGTKASGNASAKVNVTTANSGNSWYVQFYQTNIPLVSGQKYTVTFSAKASSNRSIEAVIQKNSSPYTLYWATANSLTTEWQQFTYTFTAPATDSNAFIGFNMASNIGSVWVDAVSVSTTTTQTTPTPTITLPTGTPTPSQAVPTPTSASKIVVYDDALSPNWQSWSWDAVINFASNTFYTGTKAISYLASAAWSGIDLHNPNGVSTNGLTTLHFVLKASQPNQKYAVYLVDSNEQHLTAPLSLTVLGGDPTVDWKVYDISLATLNGSNKTIKGVVIHEISGASQPTLYIDEVELR
jgi:glucose/arabinose dehydrogenase